MRTFKLRHRRFSRQRLRSKKAITVCLIQTDPALGLENLRVFQNALTVPADLYVLPELFTVGMCGQESRAYPPDVIQNESVIQAISRLIQGRNSAVVCGLLWCDGQRYYNTATVISGNGRVERYRQRDPATRNGTQILQISRGEFFTLKLRPHFTIGLMVCSDRWAAPEFFGHYKAQGVQAIVQISDSVSPLTVRQTLSTNCQKYRLAAIVCNSAGEGKGGSCIIDAEGKLLPLRTAKESAVESLSEEPSIAVGLLTVTSSVPRLTECL